MTVTLALALTLTLAAITLQHGATDVLPHFKLSGELVYSGLRGVQVEARGDVPGEHQARAVVPRPDQGTEVLPQNAPSHSHDVGQPVIVRGRDGGGGGESAETAGLLPACSRIACSIRGRCSCADSRRNAA